MKEIKTCGISDSKDFESLWKLPKLPLTERIGPFNSEHKLSFDQELLISLPTGHVQLRYQLDPGLLYTSGEYSFRTAASTSARDGADLFASFTRSLVKGRRFKSLVDIGGNDLFVARSLNDLAEYKAVIDPVCAPIDGQVVDGIKVFGCFGEQIDLSKDIPTPDLLLCRHTLEHVAEPRKMILQWFEQCHKDCIYIIEVPCLDNLIESMRFDAVFHQHFHYYNLDILKNLIWELGGEYLGHVYHHQVSCGGALALAFRKASVKGAAPARLDIKAHILNIKKRISRYETQMTLMHDLLSELPRPVYGFGAGLMLATLGYHLRTDFSQLECILDDDPDKEGMQYENIAVKVHSTAKIKPPVNSSYLITSLEGVRPIFRRILELKPRRILTPLVT